MNTDAEEPRAGYFFIGILLVSLVVIVTGLVLYLKHIHQF